MVKQGAVFTVGFIAHDFYMMEEMLDTGTTHFLLLVEQITFSYNDQAVAADQSIEGILYPIQ